MSETERILNDIRAYLRISAASASRTAARVVLDTYEKALVYSKLDGKTAQTKIESETKIPQATISVWVTGFVQSGLTSPPDQYNLSHKALFSLQELGIELGILKKRTKTLKPSSQPPSTPESQVSTETQQTALQKTLEIGKSGTSNE